jgi:hypothetical protein
LLEPLIAQLLDWVKIVLTVATGRLKNAPKHEGITVGCCEKQVNQKSLSHFIASLRANK